MIMALATCLAGVRVQRGEVVEFNNVVPFVSEQPVGVAFVRALGVEES